jgi:curli biogenesis system outer membrane secretion channel CsgG
MNSLKIGALCALLVTGAVVPMSAFAQKSSAPAKMHKACTKCAKAGMKECSCPMPTGSVYLCKDSKCFFSEADAKKMGFKNKMGHKLVKVSTSKVPAGYKDGSKMEMKEHGKM